MSPVLDRAVYPHIFDLIVDAADNDGKIVLRTTCRDLKKRVDVALFKNLELGFRDPRILWPPFTMRSHSGRLPGPAFPSTFDDFERNPGVWKSRLQLVRVLDVNMHMSADPNQRTEAPTMCAALKSLDVIRRLPQSVWQLPIKAPVFVDVLNLHEGGGDHHVFGSNTSLLQTEFKAAKHILHVRYDPNFEKLHKVYNTFEGFACEIVFIFTAVEDLKQNVLGDKSEITDSSDDERVDRAVGKDVDRDFFDEHSSSDGEDGTSITEFMAHTLDTLLQQAEELGMDVTDHGDGHTVESVLQQAQEQGIPLHELAFPGEEEWESEESIGGEEDDSEFGDEDDGANPFMENATDEMVEAMVKSRCVFGTAHNLPQVNLKTGRPLPVARSPLHSFVSKFLECAVWYQDSQPISFVGVVQMQRYLLGVNPDFDHARVEEALRMAIKIIGMGEGIKKRVLDDILGRIRFLSHDQYRAEVGEAAWELESGWSPRRY